MSYTIKIRSSTIIMKNENMEGERFTEFFILGDKHLKVVLLSSCYKEGPLWNGGIIAPINMDIFTIKYLTKKITDIENPDYIIYNYHGGTEFNIIPEPRRRIFFHKLIQECGIDIVIGHHAHVPQGVEWINNKPIIYGLGNFCFDFDYHKNVPYTNSSYFVCLDLEKNGQISLKRHFYIIDYEKQMVLLNENQSLKNGLYLRLQVFENDTLYLEAWEKECFNRICGNKLDQALSSPETLPYAKGKEIIYIPQSEKLIQLIRKYGVSLLPMIIMTGFNELINTCTRPFVFGTLSYLFKRRFRL